MESEGREGFLRLQVPLRTSSHHQTTFKKIIYVRTDLPAGGSRPSLCAAAVLLYDWGGAWGRSPLPSAWLLTPELMFLLEDDLAAMCPVEKHMVPAFGNLPVSLGNMPHPYT